MNERERKLVILLGATAFVIVNLALYFKIYEPWKKEARTQINNSQTVVEKANLCLNAQDQFDDEIRWLEKYRPKAAARQDVEAALQRFAQTEAMRNGLTIKPAASASCPPSSIQASNSAAPGSSKTSAGATTRSTAGSTACKLPASFAPSPICAWCPTAKTTPCSIARWSSKNGSCPRNPARTPTRPIPDTDP